MVARVARMISVILPTYNGSAYLAAALHSVLAQREVALEVVAVDDASTDGTRELLAACPDPRLKWRQNAGRLGIGGNWNAGLGTARGDCLSWFHQDDIMFPGNLARKQAFLAEHPEVGMVFSNARLLNAEGKDAGALFDPKAQPGETIWPAGAFVDVLLFAPENPVCCPSVMMRRECLEAVGPFREDLPFTLDLEMWLRLADRFAVARLGEPLIGYRCHPRQETCRFSNVHRQVEEWRAKREFVQAGIGSPAVRRSRRSRLRALYGTRGWIAAYQGAATLGWPDLGWAIRLGLCGHPGELFSATGAGVGKRILKRLIGSSRVEPL